MYLFLIFFISLLLLGAIFIPTQFSTSKTTFDNSKKSYYIIAHRGACGLAPENTLPAIDSALAAKADCIEIDVHLSKDNEIIVIHDYTVDRTTNDKGKISELNASDIKKLDAGSFFGNQFERTKVPFLEEVIQTVNAQCKLLIEIKEKQNENTGIEKAVADLILKHHAEKWCIVQSFNDESLEEIKKYAPEIELQKLFFFKFRFIPFIFDGRITNFSFEKYEYVSAFNMHKMLTEKAFLQKLHANGKKANAWGCRKRNAYQANDMFHWDGIITDYPGDYKN
jgi:glycerophosphoryl diester phosphodiesterase